MTSPVAGARLSRSEALYRQLEQEIVGGKLPGGTRLGTKADLRERSHVAVATVNEAVRMLEMRGLIDARPGPGGGLFVKERSPLVRLRHATLQVSEPRTDLVRYCLRVRNALEPLICADAGELRTKSDLRTFERCLKRMGSADEARQYLQANWDLHRAIADVTPNHVLRELYVGLLESVEDAIEDVELDEEIRHQQNRDHRELVDAIASGDQKRITGALSSHNPLDLLEGRNVLQSASAEGEGKPPRKRRARA